MTTRSKNYRYTGLGSFTPVQLASGFALAGSILAIAIPATVRELRISPFSEPTQGLEGIVAGALSYAKGRPIQEAFPPSVGMTPPSPPRGDLEFDPPGTWEHPTWQSLNFRPCPEDCPHAFAFVFESTLGENESRFTARAHGDLDGDGVMSTFEVRGSVKAGDPEGAKREPGMYVQAELE